MEDTFPTLSTPPLFPLDPDGERDDKAIRSPSQGGYEQRRNMFTRDVIRFGVKYSCPSADRDSIDSFEATVGCVGIFTWTHPKSGNTYQVQFDKPVQYRYIRYDKNEVSFILKVV